VLSRRELESRYEVFIEQYVTTINIEGETAAAIAKTQLLPAAVRYLGELGAAGGGKGVTRIHETVSGLVDDFVEAIGVLDHANAGHPEEQDNLDHARYVQETVIPAMEGVRAVADELEKLVPDTLWPLPKYSEVLFVR
jgi:glutamine synthetase